MKQPDIAESEKRCIAAILPAAGSGQRFGGHQNKLFATLRGEPIWVHSAKALLSRPEVGRVIMAISDADRPTFQSYRTPLLEAGEIEWVSGGKERTDSVRNALDAIANDPSIEWVAIHDAARPLISDHDLASVFSAAARTGAAILATPVTGTLKRAIHNADHPAGDDCVTVDRRDLWVAQTPQVFRLDLLRLAYDRDRGRPATDDAELVQRTGHPVAIVPGCNDNIKITHPEDLSIAEAIMQAMRSPVP